MVTKNSRVTREAWLQLAYERLLLSKDLYWLIGRSIQYLDAGAAGRDGFNEEPPEGDGTLRRVAMIRFHAEATVRADPDSGDRTTPRGAVEDELYCLLDTLHGLALEHVES